MRKMLTCTVRRWIEDGASATGAALAFYCAFSLAPLLVIILALAGWIVGEAAAFDFLQSQLHLLFGGAMAGVVLEAVRNSQQAEGIVAAIVSVGTLLIGATSVFAALEAALEKILGGTARTHAGFRGWVRRRLLSLGFILALSFLLLVSLTVSTVIAGLRTWVTERYSSLLVTIGILDLVITIALMTTLFAVIYRYIPMRRLPWRLVAGGGLLTAVLFTIGKWGVGLYLAKSTVPTAFGAAASFAALLLWLYYTAQIFLLGAEFTACLGDDGGRKSSRVNSAVDETQRMPLCRNMRLARRLKLVVASRMALALHGFDAVSNNKGEIMSKPVHRVRSQVRMAMGIAATGLAAPALLLAPFAVAAAEEAVVLEDVLVTATRRTESVQDVPINITALGGDALESQGVSSLAEIMRSVPGFFVVNQGARTANRVVARGLNASPVTPTDTMGNNAGGTVSTYMGEVPLYVDLNIVDLERVEVLLGPQGTLYGAGTMGGAVRYIPRRPSFAENSLSVNGSVFGLDHGGVGGDAGFVVNLPLAETFAVRAVLNYTDDPGFIDYGFTVREAGVSNPQVPADLESVEDANDMQMWSGRLAARWKPIEALDVNLTYYYQNQKAGGRSVNHTASYGTNHYTSAGRFVEPNERENQLLALELEADLGFASLTSATGYSRYDELGQRDQSDLLITLEYSYEAFPSFSAFTLEEQEDRNFSQELRLVSQTEGPLQWLVGGFYNRSKTDGYSKEFTPGFDQFVVDNFGGAGLRPDSLEYYQVGTTDLEELAFFGELTWHVTDRWQMTVGGRWYDYSLETLSAVDFPLANTVYGGAGPDEINLEFEPGGQDDDGTLFKFNTSFDFTEEVMGYLTVSEGYRIGNSNGVAPCPDPLPSNQIACALPNEFQYFPDSTTNYEVGVHSQWLDRRLTVNAALYYIDWQDPQLAAKTANAALPITINGDGARSQGLEINFDALLTDRLRLWGNYAYVNAELSAVAPDLIATIPDAGFTPQILFDGESGDRLPGSPEHQGSLNLSYTMQFGNEWTAVFNYGIAGVSDVLTTTGGKGDGEALGGYAVNYASVDLKADAWTITLYADNLFDKYAETGVRGNTNYLQTASDIDGNDVPVRYYFKEVLRPLEFGLRFSYDFDL